MLTNDGARVAFGKKIEKIGKHIWAVHLSRQTC